MAPPAVSALADRTSAPPRAGASDPSPQAFTTPPDGAVPGSVPAAPALAPRLLTLRQAASYMSLSTWTVRTWLARGVLPAVRLPGEGPALLRRLLVDVEDLHALITRSKPARRHA